MHTDDNALLEFSAPRNLYGGEQQNLASVLCAMQGPVLGELLHEADVPWPETLEQETNGVVAARWTHVHVPEVRERYGPVGVLQLLLEAYRGDPSNWSLWQALVEEARELRFAEPALAAEPEAGALLAQVDKLRPPLITPRRGGTLEKIASELGGLATRAGEMGQWDLAAECWQRVIEIEPNNQDAQRSLDEALARIAGDVDENEETPGTPEP